MKHYLHVGTWQNNEEIIKTFELPDVSADEFNIKDHMCVLFHHIDIDKKEIAKVWKTSKPENLEELDKLRRMGKWESIPVGHSINDTKKDMTQYQ